MITSWRDLLGLGADEQQEREASAPRATDPQQEEARPHLGTSNENSHLSLPENFKCSAQLVTCACLPAEKPNQETRLRRRRLASQLARLRRTAWCGPRMQPPCAEEALHNQAHVQSVLFMKCFICKLSLLCGALYANCPCYAVFSMRQWSPA